MNVSTTGAHGAGAGEPCPRSGPTGSELGLLHEGKTAYADAAVRGRRETQSVRSGWTRRWLQQVYLRAAGRGLSPRLSRCWRACSKPITFHLPPRPTCTPPGSGPPPGPRADGGPVPRQPADHRRNGIRAPVPHRCGTALRGLQPALRTGINHGDHQFAIRRVYRGLRLGAAHPPRPHPGDERRELPPKAQPRESTVSLPSEEPDDV